MVSGVVQATLFASGDSDKLDGGPAVTWSLSAWVHPINSSSWEMAFPRASFRPTILHSRVAEALGIEDNDEVEFEIAGARFKLPVSVSDKVNSDLTVSWDAGIVTSSTFRSNGECTALLSTGDEICLLDQELFAPAKPLKSKGRGILYFDGVSRNEPHAGPAGLGFCIYTMDDNGRGGNVLVSGYRYLGSCTSNHADYQAFIEGLTWATRFNFEKLWIRGDAQLVVHQLSGKFRVKSSNLKKFYHRSKAMLDDAQADGTAVTLQHITHEKNTASEVLANFAIDLKSNTHACNWKQINLFLNPEKYAVVEEEEQEGNELAAAKSEEATGMVKIEASEDVGAPSSSEEKKDSDESAAGNEEIETPV